MTLVTFPSELPFAKLACSTFALRHFAVNRKRNSANPLSRRRGYGILFLTLICILSAVFPPLRAQAGSDRKVLVKVQPRYPEYLRIHEIGGIVKLTVEVTPKGNVKSVSPVGGNPILIDAAIEAVKQWKYESSDNTDTLEVKIDFVPKQ
jgi:TonB family protein